MSRLAKNPITIPSGVTVLVSGDALNVKGPLGELTRPLASGVSIAVADGKAQVAGTAALSNAALLGTFAAHLKNMIAGVQKAYEKRLFIEGVGYKAAMQGQDIVLNVGFSHPIKLSVPAGVKVTIDKAGILVSGIDKEKVGTFAAKIRSQRKPEPYKGKGIRYEGEYIRRKQGKKTA